MDNNPRPAGTDNTEQGVGKIDLVRTSSKPRKVFELAERVAPHRHCRQCGKPVALEATFCSDECNNSFKNGLRRKKRQLYLYYIMVIALLFLALAYVGKL